MEKHTPERTCMGGGGSHPKAALLRFVKGPDGLVWFDPAQKAPGRGAYVFPEAQYLQQAMHKKALQRKLEAQLPENLSEQVVKGIRSRCCQLLGLAKKGGMLVPGLEKTEEALKLGKARAVILADDAGANLLNKAQSWQKHNICVLSGLTKDEMSFATGVGNCAVVAVLDKKHPVLEWMRRLNAMA